MAVRVKASRVSPATWLNDSSATVYVHEVPPGAHRAIIALTPGCTYRVNGTAHGWADNMPSCFVVVDIDRSVCAEVEHSEETGVEFLPTGGQIIDRSGGGVAVDTVVVTDPENAAAPTLVTQGLSLANLRAWDVAIHAASGQTVAAGSSPKVLGWLWSDELSVWLRAPHLDRDQPSEASGNRGFVVSYAESVGMPRGRFFGQLSGLAASSGTLTVRLRGEAR